MGYQPENVGVRARIRKAISTLELPTGVNKTLEK